MLERSFNADRNTIERCYEYLGCNKRKCVMHGYQNKTACWEAEGTLCNHPGMELINKMSKDKCKYCIYYKTQMKTEIR